MTAGVLALVLVSAVIHATWNLWAKELGGVGRARTLAWLLTAVSAALYAPFAVVVYALGDWRPDRAAVVWIVGSSVIHVIYFMVLLRGYRVGDLSLVYPVARGTGPVLAAIGAILWMGEQPSVLSVAGVLLVATGVLVLTFRPGAPRTHATSVGIRYGLLTGLLIATYILWDGTAVKHVGLPAFLFYEAGEIVRVVLLAPAALADRAGVETLWRTHRSRVLGIASLSPLSYILVLLAMRHGDVSHIAPAREVSILIGAWLGGRVLGEVDRRRRIVAAVAFGLGVAALAFAR